MKSSYKKTTTSRFLRRRRDVGAVTVELCIFLPLLIWIMFGIFQFGFIFFKEIELTNLSRDAMRYLAVQGVNGSGPNTTAYASDTTANSLLWYVKQECTNNGTMIAYSDVTVTITNYGTGTTGTTITTGQTTNLPAAGSRVAVTIQYNMTKSNTILLSPLVPFASNFLGEQSRTTQMIMEYPIS